MFAKIGRGESSGVIFVAGRDRSGRHVGMMATRFMAMAAFLAAGATCASAAPPAGLQAVRTSFAAAVAARDLKRVVALSDFPVSIEMTGAPPKLSARQFLTDKRNFDNLFGPPDAGLVHCIGTAAAQRQDDAKSFGHGLWFVDCNGNEFYFALRRGHWVFAGYENINE
jgi:hypothetical protein